MRAILPQPRIGMKQKSLYFKNQVDFFNNIVLSVHDSLDPSTFTDLNA
jgi:hypothetical protein